MDRDAVLNATTQILEKAGWKQSRVSSGCFNLFATDDTDSLILKVVSNIDSAGRTDTEEIRRACRFLGASPVVIGVKTARRTLAPQVIYERYGVPAIRPETLHAYLALNEKTVVRNRRGGYAIALDTEKLDEKREKHGFSVNALAKEVGVSTRTMINYLDRGTAAPEKAERLQNVLGDVTASITIRRQEVDAASDHDHPVAARFLRIGLDASGFSKAPFDAAARDDEDRFIAHRYRSRSRNRLLFLQELTDLAETTTFLVTDRNDDYDGIATVPKKRLRRVRTKDELKDEISA